MYYGYDNNSNGQALNFIILARHGYQIIRPIAGSLIPSPTPRDISIIRGDAL